MEEVASFPLEGYGVAAMAALPGGRIATRLHFDRDIQVWTTAGDLVATLDSHNDDGDVNALACTPAGDIVSGLSDDTVLVWHDYACVRTIFAHDFAVLAVAASSLDDTIVSGSKDKTAKVWSASTAKCVATLRGHTDAVSAVCVLDNGDVGTGSQDNTVRVWARGSWMCTAAHEEAAPVRCLAACPGGGLAVGGGEDFGGGFVSLWRGGRREWSVETGRVDCVAVVQDLLVACTKTFVEIIQDGVTLKLVDAENPYVAAMSKASFAMATGRNSDLAVHVYRVVRPSRIATILIMITAWSAYGGAPPAASDAESAAAVLARTLSLRRLCRPHVDGDAVEVVEPLSRDIVGFM